MNKLFQTITSPSENESTYGLDTRGRTISDPATEDKVFIRGLTLDMHIGVSEQEKSISQPVLVDVELEVRGNPTWKKDDIDGVISYEDIKNGIEDIASQKTFSLLETFGEYITEYCLSYEGCLSARIRCHKPEIFETTQSAGIELFRLKSE